ncbi:MAG: SDR family NAD(P)-dependent oxidoreductase [Candidatus Heimdallarchaeaceae archaeon]
MKVRKRKKSANDLPNSVIVITGASSGIGAQVARELAVYKPKLVIFARREKKLRELERELGKKGAKVVSVVGDVRVEEDRQRLVNIAQEKYGKIDILFNNAGLGKNIAFLEQTDEEIDQLIETNLTALIKLTKKVVNVMKEKRNGLIINMSSAIAFVPTYPFSIYCVTKMAVKTFGESLRYELKKYAIKVSTVYPALHGTDFCKVANIDQQKFKAHDKIKLARQIVKIMQKPKKDVVYPKIYWPIVWVVKNFGLIRTKMSLILAKQLADGRIEKKKKNVASRTKASKVITT